MLAKYSCLSLVELELRGAIEVDGGCILAYLVNAGSTASGAVSKRISIDLIERVKTAHMDCGLP